MTEWVKRVIVPGGFRGWGSFARWSTGRGNFYVKPQGIRNLILDASRGGAVVDRTGLDERHTHIFG